MTLRRAFIACLIVLAPLVVLASLVVRVPSVLSQSHIRTKISKPLAPATTTKKTAYVPPRPDFAGLRLMMPADSARMIMRAIALRQQGHIVDSMSILESDSVRLFGQSAYLQLQFISNKLRTIVINFHPLAGDRYFNTRDQVARHMEKFLGRGVIFQDNSLTYRRWTTEDGQMEVSHSDKYYRVFIRLGKNPLV